MDLSVSQRIKEFIELRGISQEKFRIDVGAKGKTQVSKWFSFEEGIPASYLTEIIIKYHDLNPRWLVTGVGEMILEDSSAPYGSGKMAKNDLTMIPLLPISAQGGSLNQFFVSIKDSDCEHIISPIKDAEFAITVSGESMAPAYPNGSKILIKKIDEKKFIEWGREYVLDTCNGTVVKTLVNSDKEGFVMCISLNPDPKFAPFFVNTEDIIGVYRVMMCLTAK